jgi:hemoglobin
MATHARLHSRIPLSEEAFKRWAGLMMNTIDEMFAGERANLMKRRAESIAAVMRIKILGGQV